MSESALGQKKLAQWKLESSRTGPKATVETDVGAKHIE